eukprot:843443-Pyramimonas_sp.AAC.1
MEFQENRALTGPSAVFIPKDLLVPGQARAGGVWLVAHLVNTRWAIVQAAGTGLLVWVCVRMCGHEAGGAGVCAHVRGQGCGCGCVCARVGMGLYICYADPPPLFFRVERGHVHIWSEQGTQQGDPLGCFYLSLPLHEVLGDLHREHPVVVITAYIGNVFLIAPPAAVQPTYRDLVRQMLARLDSQARKCAVYSPTGD